MKNKKEKDQQPTNQEVKGNNPSAAPLNEAMTGIPPEEKDTKKVIKQNRYVTYFRDESSKENKNTQEESKENTQEESKENSTEKAKEEVKTKTQSSKEPDEIETLSQEDGFESLEFKDEYPDKTDDTNQTNQINSSNPSETKTASSKNNAVDKALQSFAQVLIKHLETVEIGNWEKPWLDGTNLRWPRNLDGREYAANNTLILLMDTQQNGYQAPIYATFDRIKKLNYDGRSNGEPLKDAEGNPLPMVHVKEGQKSTPVVKTLYTPVHKETKEKIPFADYAKLSDAEKKEYDVYPRNFVYRVFNIDQTNLKEARPELYAQLTKADEKVAKCVKREVDMSFPAVDAMIMKGLWQCPITVGENSAYYHKGKDKIYIPEKWKFKYPEIYYGTLFHECAHSTGAPKRYNRDMGNNSPKKYAREELVAELTAALVASRYGLIKHVKSDSLPYLKTWLKALREEPEFIKQLLTDVRKASTQIIRRVDLIQNRVEELRNMGVPQPEHYPDFLDLDPITSQPVDDPVRYPAKEEKTESQEQRSVGRGRR